MQPYNPNNSGSSNKVFNFFFHPLDKESSIKRNTAAVITNIALTIFSLGIWQFISYKVRQNESNHKLIPQIPDDKKIPGVAESSPSAFDQGRKLPANDNPKAKPENTNLAPDTTAAVNVRINPNYKAPPHIKPNSPGGMASYDLNQKLNLINDKKKETVELKAEVAKKANLLIQEIDKKPFDVNKIKQLHKDLLQAKKNYNSSLNGTRSQISSLECKTYNNANYNKSTGAYVENNMFCTKHKELTIQKTDKVDEELGLLFKNDEISGLMDLIDISHNKATPHVFIRYFCGNNYTLEIKEQTSGASLKQQIVDKKFNNEVINTGDIKIILEGTILNESDLLPNLSDIRVHVIKNNKNIDYQNGYNVILKALGSNEDEYFKFFEIRALIERHQMGKYNDRDSVKNSTKANFDNLKKMYNNNLEELQKIEEKCKKNEDYLHNEAAQHILLSVLSDCEDMLTKFEALKGHSDLQKFIFEEFTESREKLIQIGLKGITSHTMVIEMVNCLGTYLKALAYIDLTSCDNNLDANTANTILDELQKVVRHMIFSLNNLKKV